MGDTSEQASNYPFLINDLSAGVGASAEPLSQVGASHNVATLNPNGNGGGNGSNNDGVGDEVQERVQNWVCVRQKHGVLFRLH